MATWRAVLEGGCSYLFSGPLLVEHATLHELKTNPDVIWWGVTHDTLVLYSAAKLWTHGYSHVTRRHFLVIVEVPLHLQASVNQIVPKSALVSEINKLVNHQASRLDGAPFETYEEGVLNFIPRVDSLLDTTRDWRLAAMQSC